MTSVHTQILFRLAQHERAVREGMAWDDNAVWNPETGEVSYRVMRKSLTKGYVLVKKFDKCSEQILLDLKDKEYVEVSEKDGKICCRLADRHKILNASLGWKDTAATKAAMKAVKAALVG